MAINCEYSTVCTEAANPTEVFGNDRYVGHDEPSNIFYSATPGAGNRASYSVTLPSDPSADNPGAPGKSFQFQLNGALWFGMALCDTQSYPEQVSTCPADSDSNIANNPLRTAPDYIGHHSGTAFVEVQFYPPGWAPLAGNAPIGGESCDPVKWCAAMVIWSLGADGNFTANNNDCLSNSNGGEEFGNASFITFTGHSPIPATPYKNPGAFAPNPNSDMYFNPGDCSP